MSCQGRVCGLKGFETAECHCLEQLRCLQYQLFMGRVGEGLRGGGTGKKQVVFDLEDVCLLSECVTGNNNQHKTKLDNG